MGCGQLQKAVLILVSPDEYFFLNSNNYKTFAMLKIGELKQGDVIMVNDDGVMREGTISKVSHDDNQAYVDNGIQEFWYEPGEMFPLPLDENQLMKLGFEKVCEIQSYHFA